VPAILLLYDVKVFPLHLCGGELAGFVAALQCVRPGDGEELMSPYGHDGQDDRDEAGAMQGSHSAVEPRGPGRSECVCPSLAGQYEE
jgi:hypothetical protein